MKGQTDMTKEEFDKTLAEYQARGDVVGAALLLQRYQREAAARSATTPKETTPTTDDELRQRFNLPAPVPTEQPIDPTQARVAAICTPAKYMPSEEDRAAQLRLDVRTARKFAGRRR